MQLTAEPYWKAQSRAMYEQLELERCARRIVEIVAQRHGLHSADLRGPDGHNTKTIDPRGMAMKLVRDFTGWRDHRIGRFFGGRISCHVEQCTHRLASRIAKSEDLAADWLKTRAAVEYEMQPRSLAA